MKHIIIIETSDDKMIQNEPEGAEFQEQCVKMLEYVCDHFVGESFIQSSFYQESAVDAVAEMYDIPDRSKEE